MIYYILYKNRSHDLEELAIDTRDLIQIKDKNGNVLWHKDQESKTEYKVLELEKKLLNMEKNLKLTQDILNILQNYGK